MEKTFENLIAYNNIMFAEIFGTRKKVSLSSIDENDLFDLTKDEFCIKYDVSGNEYENLHKQFQEI